VATGLPLSPWINHAGQVKAVAFHPNGRVVASGDDRGTVHLWQVPSPILGPVNQVMVAAEVLTVCRLSEENTLLWYHSDSWLELRRKLSALGSPFTCLPDLQSWHQREAWSSERERRWFAALWHLQRVSEGGQEEALRQSHLCRAYFERHEIEPAIAAATQAIALAPDSYVPRFDRGLIYSQLGRWDSALNDYAAALERNQTDWQVWYERAWMHAQCGHREQALADLERAAELPGAYPEVWSDSAYLHLAAGDEDAYRKACADLLSRTSSNSQNTRFTGMTWAEYNRQAYHFLSTTIRRFGPTSPEELNARVAWTCSLGRGGLPDYAPLLQRMQEFVSRASMSYPFARAYAATLYRANQFEKALEQLNRAMTLRTQPSPSVWVFLAMSHHRLNHNEEAKKWLDQANTWIKQARETKATDALNPDTLSWSNLPWTERLTLEVLQREAESLIQPVKEKAPKVGPG
jgi:tetratricopeptide (TPR) repeat protein